MVGPARNNTSLDSVFFVPACVSVNDKDSLTQVQEVDSSLLVGSVALDGAGNVDISPVDRIACDIIDNNSLLLGHSTGFASGGNAQSTRLCNRVGSDSRVW